MIDMRKILCLLIVASWTATASAEFQQSVRPLLEKHCLACHGPKKQEGDLRFDGLTGNLSAHPAEADVWAAILEQLESGAMPPEKRSDNGCGMTPDQLPLAKHFSLCSRARRPTTNKATRSGCSGAGIRSD